MSPDLRVVFSTSSLFDILNVIANLSKCCISYEMQGLSYWQMIYKPLIGINCQSGLLVSYIDYTSSHTGISIPLYTTTILCSIVLPIAFLTVSVSA